MLAAGNVSSDRNVVRFVGEDKPSGQITLHEPPQRLRVGGATADEPVRPELKNVAQAGDGDSVRLRLERTLLHRVPGVAEDDLIDLVRGEAGDLNRSVVE